MMLKEMMILFFFYDTEYYGNTFKIINSNTSVKTAGNTDVITSLDHIAF